MTGLELDEAEGADRVVAPARVVEGLDPSEGRRGGSGVRLPVWAVDEFPWRVPDELSAITLSSASPAAHIEPRIPAVRGLPANVHDAS